MVEINELEFKDTVLKSDIPVVVDFWAPWCGPCKSLAPVLEELSEELKGGVLFVKANVEDCDDLVNEYSISGIPTLLFIKGGEVVEKISGMTTKSKVIEKLELLK